MGSKTRQTDARRFPRLRSVFNRITRTPYTAGYFIIALASGATQIAFHSLAFTDNDQANAVLDHIVTESRISGFTTKLDGILQVCNGIPGQSGTTCAPIVVDLPASSNVTPRSFNSEAFRDEKRDLSIAVSFDPDGLVQGVSVTDPIAGIPPSTLGIPCVQSLQWFSYVLRDTKREDLVGIVFQVWLLSLSVLTILNESIPHLCAAVIAQILGLVCASLRIKSQLKMTELYKDFILARTCGVDIFGTWFDIRLKHTVPIFIVGGASLVGALFLSAVLLTGYAKQASSRVGASPHIHRIYRYVLIMSVCLQLAGFVSVVASALWIDKICHGTVHKFAKHARLYTVLFIVSASLQLPWLVSGWVSIRRERRRLYLMFCALGFVLFGISTFMFSSTLYRFIFNSWPFFATVTAGSYLFLVTTFLLGLLCRFHFDEGLVHYLHVKDILETDDFTPVSFFDDPEKLSEEEDNDAFSYRAQPTLGFLEKSKIIPISSDTPTKVISLQRPKSAVLDIRRSKTPAPSFVLDIRASLQPSISSAGYKSALDHSGTNTSSGTFYSFLDFEPPSPASCGARSLSKSRSIHSSASPMPPSPSTSPSSEMPSLPTPVLTAGYTLPPLSPISTFGMITRQSSFKSQASGQRKASLRRQSSFPPGLGGHVSRWSADSSHTSIASNRNTYATSHLDADVPLPPVPDLSNYTRMPPRRLSRSRTRRAPPTPPK